MNEQVEACRSKAFECEHKALTANQDQIRRLYWQLAGLWRDIARLNVDLQDERERLGALSP